MDSFVGSMEGGSLVVFSACRGGGGGSHFSMGHQAPGFSKGFFWVILFIGGRGLCYLVFVGVLLGWVVLLPIFMSLPS